MKLRSLAAGLLLLVAGAACSNDTEPGQATSTGQLLASVASKAIDDSGFAIPAAIYVREALYEDEMAIQFEGDPQFLSEQNKKSIRSSIGDLAAVTFFTDPSVVVDDDWNTAASHGLYDDSSTELADRRKHEDLGPAHHTPDLELGLPA